MRKVEPLPTRDCEAGYGPDPKCKVSSLLFLKKETVLDACGFHGTIQTILPSALGWN